MSLRIATILLFLLVWCGQASAQTPPTWTPVEGDVAIGDLPMARGETLTNARMHYRTLGEPRRDANGHVTNAVMLLHGTGGTGATFLSPQFAGELFGPGQPLDVTRYYVIMPDGLGHGGSSKPSDGLRARFPEYGYDDMVEAQRRMLVDGLHVDHLRLILGTSMGCMHAFVWGETHPDFADALMPMACDSDRRSSDATGCGARWSRTRSGRIRPGRAATMSNSRVQGLRTAVDLLLLAGGATMPMQHDLATPRGRRRLSGDPAWRGGCRRWTPTTSGTRSMPRGTTTLRRIWRGSRRR